MNILNRLSILAEDSKVQNQRKLLEKKTPYELAQLYYGDTNIPKGVKLEKEKLIQGILEDMFGKNAVKSKILSAKDWVQDVEKERENHPLPENEQIPEGLFTKPASQIVNGLLKVSKNDIGKAIRKITYYMNRAGKDLTNKNELEKAKEELQKRNEKKKEQSSVLAESINLNTMEVKNPEDSLKFIKLSKTDAGFQNIDSYFINDIVQNKEIKDKFYSYISKNFDKSMLKNQVSTDKSSGLQPDIESFLEDIFGRPFKVYFGDGLFGIWVAKIPFNKKNLIFLQMEEPKTPATRMLCVNSDTDVSVLNKMLKEWKGSKMKVLSKVKKKVEAYEKILDPKVYYDGGFGSDLLILTSDKMEKLLDVAIAKNFPLAKLQKGNPYHPDMQYLNFHGETIPLLYQRTGQNMSEADANKILKQANDLIKKTALNTKRNFLSKFQKLQDKEFFGAIDDLESQLHALTKK